MLKIDLEFIIMCVLSLAAVFGFGYICGWSDSTEGFVDKDIPAGHPSMRDWKVKHDYHSD